MPPNSLTHLNRWNKYFITYPIPNVSSLLKNYFNSGTRAGQISVSATGAATANPLATVRRRDCGSTEFCRCPDLNTPASIGNYARQSRLSGHGISCIVFAGAWISPVSDFHTVNKSRFSLAVLKSTLTSFPSCRLQNSSQSPNMSDCSCSRQKQGHSCRHRRSPEFP